jgi:hypothetical protein
MKRSVWTALLATLLTVPVVTSAQQSDRALTRAQVRAELIRFEQAGYHSANGEDPYYPADVEAVTAKLQAPDGTKRDAAFLAYGGSSDGRSQTGSNIVEFGTGRSIYFGR